MLIQVLGVASAIFAVCAVFSALVALFQLLDEIAASKRLERLAKERRSGKGGEPHV